LCLVTIEQDVQECPLNDHMSKLMLCVYEIQNVNLVWLTVKCPSPSNNDKIRIRKLYFDSAHNKTVQ
jgi:hypothetical protein